MWYIVDPSWGFFADWSFLKDLVAVFPDAFRPAGLMIPGRNASMQVRADAYTALLSGDPWPAPCERFLRVAWEPYHGLVATYCSTQSLQLSLADDIAAALILITFRNAGSWHRRRRETHNGSWVGFPLRHIPSLVKRQVPDVRVIESGSIGTGTLLDRGTPSHLAASRRLSDEDRARVRAAVRGLSPRKQRAVRLTNGWWPARKAWSRQKVAKYLQLSDVQLDRLLAAAHAELRKGLQGVDCQ